MGLLTKASTWIARSLRLTDQRLYHFLGGVDTDAGELVSVETSLQLDTVWACVRLISETIATLPLHLYQTDKSGHGVIADQHPLYRVLHDRPNFDMTSVEYWGAKVSAEMLWGNGYSAIEKDSNGRIISLVPLHPERTLVHREPDGSLSYRYSYLGQVQTFTEDQIFHIKGFSLDGLIGLSPISQARQTLGSTRAAERASGSLFRNGMRPSGYLKAPLYLTTSQRADAQAILSNFKGAQNTGAVPLLEGGWEFTSISIPPEDAQLLGTRTFHVEQICRWFGVPPILVGHSGQTTWGSGIEQIVLGWLTLGLRAHLKRIEQAINKALLSPLEQQTMYAEFNIEGLLRADTTARAAFYATSAQNGVMTRNEIRAKENLPRFDGADDLTVQSNLIPIKDLGVIARIPQDRAVTAGADMAAASSSTGPKPPDNQNTTVQ